MVLYIGVDAMEMTPKFPQSVVEKQAFGNSDAMTQSHGVTN